MRKTAVLAAMTVLVLSGGSTYAFAAGSDDGPNHDRAVAGSVSAGDDHRDRRAEAGDDRGAHQTRHHARHQARHHRHTAHHARHRHVEAGDDHGRRHGGEAERGDDHGGRHGGHGSDD